jgi:C_GCAxxG_C_C family probable redox protein
MKGIYNMKDLAIKFHREGYNCSQCIIKAYDEKYGKKFDASFYKALNGIYNGFGVGSLCSVFVACVMVLSLEFSEDEIAQKRMIFCNNFYEKFGGINCSKLKKDYDGCEYIIGSGAEMLEKMINEIEK